MKERSDVTLAVVAQLEATESIASPSYAPPVDTRYAVHSHIFRAGMTARPPPGLDDAREALETLAALREAVFEHQTALMSTFSLYFNTGNPEGLAHLLRSSCTPDCSVVRYRSEDSFEAPSRIVGVEGIVQYSALLLEAFPDAVLELEENGRSEAAILFGYRFSGTRLLDVHIGKDAAGEPVVHRIPVHIPKGGRPPSLELSGVISLVLEESGLIDLVEVRILNGF